MNLVHFKKFIPAKSEWGKSTTCTDPVVKSLSCKNM